MLRFCEAEKESLKVIDSRTAEGGRAIRRRRECLKCSKRFTTYERIEDNLKLTVVKRDGRRHSRGIGTRFCWALNVPVSNAPCRKANFCGLWTK